MSGEMLCFFNGWNYNGKCQLGNVVSRTWTEIEIMGFLYISNLRNIYLLI